MKEMMIELFVYRYKRKSRVTSPDLIFVLMFKYVR